MNNSSSSFCDRADCWDCLCVPDNDGNILQQICFMFTWMKLVCLGDIMLLVIMWKYYDESRWHAICSVHLQQELTNREVSLIYLEIEPCAFHFCQKGEWSSWIPWRRKKKIMIPFHPFRTLHYLFNNARPETHLPCISMRLSHSFWLNAVIIFCFTG